MTAAVGWYSIDDTDAMNRIVEAWSEAPLENEEVLGMLLDIAREQVLAYAPLADQPTADNPKPKVRLVYAQLQQAKNLWSAGSVSPAGEFGSEGYSFTPRPLDKVIRGIIRPVRGTIDVF